VALGLGGCALPVRHGAHQPPYAFITYSAPPAGNQKLRLAVKDNIDVKGIVTTAGSGYFEKNSAPAARDAACLAIARKRGVVIVGKTNLSEFAVSPSGINEHFGTPRNPFEKWYRPSIPGGSSSGSAQAIVMDLADVAFGTDTAGSIRVPAAACGIVGLKTTFGLVPLKGVVPIDAKYLDTVGPMAKDIANTVKGMDLLQEGFAARYAAATAAKPTARSIRIGRLYLSGTDPNIDRAVDDALTAKGFQVVELDDAFKAKWDQAEKDGTTMAAGGAWLSDGQYALRLDISARTKAAILLGKIVYPEAYEEALGRRAEWQAALRQVFKKVDFIALPTLQGAPLRIPLLGKVALLETAVLKWQNTVPVNYAGNPALAVPIPVRHESVPVTSLQLVGPRFSEAQLLNAGRLIEEKP
jgi:Asp-tRNA(Asn)/Glu-tRNA(Gln) amidotransferase A subunit family amidase